MSLVLKAEPMTRVLIVVPRTSYHRVIEELYELRSLHIHDHREGRDGLELGRPLEGASEASEMLIRLRAMIATLGLAGRTVDRPLPIAKVMAELEAHFDHMESEIETLGENRNRLRAEVRNIEQRLVSLEPFIAIGLDLDAYHPYENLEITVGTASGNPTKALVDAGIDHELFRAKDPSKSGLFALFVDIDRTDEARTILGEMNFAPVPVYEGKGDPRAERVALKEGLARVTSALEETELSIRTLRKVHGEQLLAAEEHLSIQVEKAESPLRCGSTPNALFIEGWVPEHRSHDLRKHLEAAVGDAFHMEVLADEDTADHGDVAAVAPDGGEPDEVTTGADGVPDAASETPVMFHNPEPVKVHEYLVSLISTPRYDEMDPALFMFFTFPIMFGMMVGDIGYGLLFVLFGWVLIKLQSDRGLMGRHWYGVGVVAGLTRVRMTKMIMLSGVATMAWGFIFGEAWGLELFSTHGILWPHNLYVPSMDLYLPINRLEDAMLMIVLCIYIGIFHIMLGLFMGFFNELSHHGVGHAFLAKFSWVFIIIGGFMVFKLFFTGGDMSVGNLTFVVSLSLLIGGIILLILGEGGGGVLELPGIISNILSYTRLFAIGLSSLGIAMTFNNLGMMLAASGIVGAIFGIIVACLGHLINMFLALLAPSLHALRLHYVEWMTKFYSGGGVPYEPFGRERVYTEV